jgi:predicted GTPase
MKRNAARRTVTILGKRGVGKSSTLNYLFGFCLATDAAAECTKMPSAHLVTSPEGQLVRIIDMPGIAANLRSGARYHRYYRRWLKRADVVVWITQADVRAYKQDQIFFRDYARFVRPRTRLVLALSKFDTQIEGLGPQALMSRADEELLKRKLDDTSSEILPYSWADSHLATVIPYSVARQWNTEALRLAILAA